MAIARLYFRRCDVCGRPSSGEAWETAREATDQARCLGWAYQAGCDICPACRRAGWTAKARWDDGYTRKLRRIAS